MGKSQLTPDADVVVVNVCNFIRARLCKWQVTCCDRQVSDRQGTAPEGRATAWL
jgi:hypothetical protein